MKLWRWFAIVGFAVATIITALYVAKCYSRATLSSDDAARLKRLSTFCTRVYASLQTNIVDLTDPETNADRRRRAVDNLKGVGGWSSGFEVELCTGHEYTPRFYRCAEQEDHDCLAEFAREAQNSISQSTKGEQ